MRGSILLFYLLFLSVLFLVGVVSAGIIYQDDTFILGEISNSEIASVEGYSSCLTSLGSYIDLESDYSENRKPSFKCFRDGDNIKIEKNAYVYDVKCTYACHKNNNINADVKLGYVDGGTYIGTGLDCGLTIANFKKLRITGYRDRGWVSCQYDKNTGVISSTYSEKGWISKCGYICVDKESSNSRNVKSHSYYEYGSDNIGSNLECAIGTTRFYGECSNFNVQGASYDEENGDFVKGFDACTDGNFGYFCADKCGNGICAANECKTAVSEKIECSQDCQYQCLDDCDNDNDGEIDFLIEDFSTSGGKTETFGIVSGKGNPKALIRLVVAAIEQKNLPYEINSEGSDRLMRAVSTQKRPRHDEGGTIDQDTLDKVCEILGYQEVVTSTCRDSEISSSYPIGKCNWHSANDNGHYFYEKDGDKFSVRSPGYYRTWIATITCAAPFPACNDDIDNDGDGKTDYPEDLGCGSANDINEAPQDLFCTSDTDDDEDLDIPPQCDDDENNDDNDDLIDYCKDDDSNADTCDPDCDSPDDSEVPECNDDEDNDGDGKKDYCKDDGSNADTCDSNCQSLDDDNEACESDQIIMKLETEGDSLGALWNDANYNVNICYEEIFGEEYVGNTPQDCDGDNKVLGLEHSTKAYAETPESTIYDYDHCDGADIDRNKIVEKADLDEYIEKLKSDCRNIADVDINLILDALNDPNFDTTCTANNNFCELLDINGDDELVPGDMGILVDLKNGCTGTGNPNIVSNADLNEDGYVNYLDREILLIALADKPIGTVDCDEVDISNNVCYGDLRCRSIDTSDSNAGSCDGPGEKIVANLSAATDAKISKGDVDFPIKICCRLEVTQLERAYWAYINDGEIESKDSEGNDVIIDLKDKVKLVAVGKEFKDENIEYTIYKKCENIVECFFNLFTGNDVVAQTTVKGEFVWDAGKKLEDNTFSEGKYHFTAEIGELKVDSRENSDEDSDELDNPNGILTVGPEDNDPPVAKIIGPEDKQIYFINEKLNFTQESYDLDDEFSYEWELNNGTETIIKKGNSSNLENYNFTYAYKGEANLGQQNIKLTVIDGRGLNSTHKVAILIINSTYILAYTDSPINGEEYQRLVEYDSRSTYAVSSTTGDDQCTKTITCEAGNCPAATKGCPPCYDGVGGPAPEDNCPIGVVGAPETLDDADYSKIEFCWIFDDEVNEEVCTFGISGALFNRSYPLAGKHTSFLKASITV